MVASDKLPSQMGFVGGPDHAEVKPFTGRRRPSIVKVCACGCGQKFRTTFPWQKYLNEAHKKRAYRKTSRHVKG
jgi:hypothetical protein